MIIDVELAKKWLRVDADDEDDIVELLVDAAEEYLEDATGKQFDATHKKARLFCLVLVADWFDNRELIGQKPSEKVRASIQSILAQLQHAPERGDSSGV